MYYSRHIFPVVDSLVPNADSLSFRHSATGKACILTKMANDDETSRDSFINVHPSQWPMPP